MEALKAMKVTIPDKRQTKTRTLLNNVFGIGSIGFLPKLVESVNQNQPMNALARV